MLEAFPAISGFLNFKIFSRLSPTNPKYALQSLLKPKPIYTIRFVLYDSDPGVCDRIITRTNVMFQISLSTNEQKMWHQHSLSYARTKNRNIYFYSLARMTVIYDKSHRVDRPLSQSNIQRRKKRNAVFTAHNCCA